MWFRPSRYRNNKSAAYEVLTHPAGHLPHPDGGPPDYDREHYSMALLNRRFPRMNEFVAAVKALSATLDAFGIKLALLISSSLGSITAAIITPGSWLYRILSGLAGAIAAIFIGPPVAHFLDWLMPDSWGVPYDELLPATGYICGLAGLTFIQAVIDGALHVKSKVPKMLDKRMK